VTRTALPRGHAVELRRPHPRDRDEFLTGAQASRSLHRRWGPVPSTEEEFASFLRRSRMKSEERLLLRRCDDGALVGVFNLNQIFMGPFRNAYLGYYVFAPYEGRGYMREGLGLALEHAFGSLGLHRLEANIQPQNVRSIALVRGAGFRLEGYSPRYLKIGDRWRDHQRWAITVEDLPRRAAPSPTPQTRDARRRRT
jgi:ribosomal-protein-alanine N-acetyltransferase